MTGYKTPELPRFMQARSMLAACALASLACAQSRAWTGASFLSEDYEKLVRCESPLYEVEWFWPTGSGSQSGVESLPFDDAAEVLELGPNDFLIAGVDSVSGQGWLSTLTISVNAGAASAQVRSESMGGRDFSCLFYDGPNGTLYGVDDATHSLLIAPFSIGDQPPATWTAIASATECPILAEVPGFALHFESVGSGVIIRSDGSYAHNPWRVEQVAGVWTSTVDVGAPIVVPPVWYTGRGPVVAASESEYTIRVGGGQGLFGVRHEPSQQIVFVGTHTGNQEFESFDIPISSLVYGDEYKIVSLAGQGFGDSVMFRVEQYWDRVSQVTPGFLPGPVSMRWDYPSVGTDFMSWSLYWDGVTPRPQGPALFTIILGEWQPHVSPTTSINGLEILTVQYGTFPTTVTTWDRDRVDVGYAFRVDDPSFTGAEVAIQAIGLMPSGDLFVSDVRGVILQ